MKNYRSNILKLINNHSINNKTLSLDLLDFFDIDFDGKKELILGIKNGGADTSIIAKAFLAELSDEEIIEFLDKYNWKNTISVLSEV